MKQRSIVGSLARRLAVGLFCFWLLIAALVTWMQAGDLQRQGAEVYTAALEQALADFRAEQENAGEIDASNTVLTLPEVSFVPKTSMPLLRMREMPLLKGSLTLIARGVVMQNDGFDMTGIPLGSVGLNITEGKLAIMNPSEIVNAAGMKVDTSQLGFFLTFLADPLRFGSFPSAEISGDYAGEKVNSAMPVVVVVPTQMTAVELMDNIDSGAWHFDSDGLRQSSRLRGCWLRDGAGEKRCLIVAAYGWCPLFEALWSLIPVYLISLVLFQLLGVVIWLSIRSSMVKPLTQLERSLWAEPLSVTSAEYDCLLPYGELRGPVAAYLLRRQMMQAAATVASIPQRPAEECPLLLTELQRAEGKLLPILMDRGQKIERELTADGRVSAGREQLEDALLALFRETVDYALQGEKMTIRTLERAGFLLAEIEVKAKLRNGELACGQLWDGIYRSPADGDAPGAKLRKAMWRLPGSFATVRKTKKGLALTLGLPKKE